MDSKYCSGCLQKCLLSSFLADASANPGSKVFATCILCRDRRSKTKRKALQPLDPNIQAKRRVPRPTKAPTRLNPSILPPNPVEAPPVPAETGLEELPQAETLEPSIAPPVPAKTRPEATIPPPNPPESRLEYLSH